MKFNIGIFEENISKAFCSIMSDSFFSEKRKRRYRIYIFIFIFGCIHEYDMQYVFPEDIEQDIKSFKEILNAHRSVLNFLARKGELGKITDGYFILKKSGLQDLYDFLTSRDFIQEAMDFNSFFRKYRPPKTFLSHSSKTGRIVLSFVRNFGMSFIREPIINSQGAIDGSLPGTAYNNFIIPDALLFCNDDDENIFIEADSSLERINSKIVPKLENYISYVLSDNIASSPTTIHFSVWNAANVDDKFYNCSYELNKIIDFYNFIKSELNVEMDFFDYIKFVNNYSGAYQPVCELSSILTNYRINEASSIMELQEKMTYSYYNDYFRDDYILRSNSIFSCSKKIKNFNKLLLKGTRFVCTPTCSYDSLYKFIYLEKNTASIKAYIESSLSPNFTFIEYKKIHCFIDDKTGLNIYFRNVFIYEYNGKNKYFSFENISDDISGLIRSKYYAYSYQIPSIGDFSLYCIYNEHIEDNPNLIFERSKRLEDSINFISYKEFSSLS